MDWFSWLSKTTLDPSLIYDYGLIFARNELQLQDASYFNHEFLQSMGISIAKHRLEILKLVKKDQHHLHSLQQQPKNLSSVIKKCLKKCMSKFVSRDDNDVKKNTNTVLHEPNWHQKWKGENQKPVSMCRSRTMPYSGPLDGRMMNERKFVNNKALKLSGPIDGRMMQERMVYTNRSPLRTRPVDGRFTGTVKSPRVSGPFDAKMLLEINRSPTITRASVETDSPMGYCSPYNKPKGDEFDLDDEHKLWPTLFDLNPT
ncbi:unnamed protein product [Vicia faba]|uniref:SAM domain-containing protein n=1 Tax=Vicia faba TaxID=3906 RepID=A0AAV1AJF8_VICFA|nr:unnamed protein product [Vicia faba]